MYKFLFKNLNINKIFGFAESLAMASKYLEM